MRSPVRCQSYPFQCSILCSHAHILPPTDFTGISAPYEAPEKPEAHVNTNNSSVDDCVKQLIDYLKSQSII